VLIVTRLINDYNHPGEHLMSISVLIYINVNLRFKYLSLLT